MFPNNPLPLIHHVQFGYTKRVVLHLLDVNMTSGRVQLILSINKNKLTFSYYFTTETSSAVVVLNDFNVNDAQTSEKNEPENELDTYFPPEIELPKSESVRKEF